MLGTWVIDRLGRRATILIIYNGCFIYITLEAIIVAVYADSGNITGRNTGVTILYIFLLFYASGVDVDTYVYLGKMFPNYLRIKGVSIGLSSLTATATVYLSVTSTAFEAIGWKFFLVCFLNLPLAYFRLWSGAVANNVRAVFCRYLRP
jgi:hypothetical protein